MSAAQEAISAITEEKKPGVHALPKTKKRRIPTSRAIASFAEDDTDGCEDINLISIHPPMALSEKKRNQLERDIKGTARLDDILNSPPSRTPNLVHLKKNIQSRTSPANKRTWSGDGFEAPPVRYTFHPPTGPLIDILPTLSQSQVGQLRHEYKSIFQQVNVATHIKTFFLSNRYGGFGKVAFAVALGPYESEGWFANCWYQPGETRNQLLIEALMGKSADEIRKIKAGFKDAKYLNSLEKVGQ